MKLKTSSGIYCIYNTVNGKFYIGSAVNFSDRFSNHKWYFSNANHKNKYLQAAWNKYRESNFQIFIVEYCDKDKLREREQWWLDISKCYDRNIGYNISSSAEVPAFGTKWTEERKIEASKRMKNFRHSEESKAKMRIAQKDCMTPELKEKLLLSKLGKPKSEETKRKIGLANSTKIRSQAYKDNLRNFEKWPHGSKCRCEECIVKHREYMNVYMKNRRAKNGKNCIATT